VIPLRLTLGVAAATLFLLVLGPARRFAQWRGWRFGRGAPPLFHRLLCATLGVRVRAHGRALDGTPRLIVANHVSWLDIPVLGSIAPMTFLAKSEVGAPAFGGRIARLQGVIFVERGRRRCIPRVNAEIVAAMAKGEAVVLFAEATTGDGNRLLRFRSSHFEAARRAAAGDNGAETVVQPVFLDYTRIAGLPVGRRERPLFAWYGDMTFLPHFRRFLGAGGIVCDVHFGAPIRICAASNRKAVARATELAVRNLAGQARAPKVAIPAERGSS